MRAGVLTGYKKPLDIITTPKPTPAEDQVLIKVEYAAVNHADARTQDGEFKALFPLSFPQTMGGELVGTVVETGARVTDYQKGDVVYAYVGVGGSGAYAEYVAVDASEIALAPTTLSTQESAALPVVGLTAWQALVTMGKVQQGDSVLIHGGAGGVGSAAIQLAKHLGARVTTTASARNFDYLKDLGADTLIDYRSQDFAQELKGQQFDLVLDTQGGEVLEKSLGLTAPGGTVIGITGPPEPHFAKSLGLNPFIRLAIAGLSFKVRRLAKNYGVNYRFLFIQPSGEDLQRIATLADEGIFKPQVGPVFPLEELNDALATTVTGKPHGKVLVNL
ncbi:NADP-dependent oxidoreductase [Corynebacterium sp. 320]|uniref:NADP-dependent oxidoreductase n=1 Tax=Corynebacterium TaxID=1716 RepID=UPI00125CAF74|nr:MULTISPECIES: NADP-dependent oxidoreductase [Corynebacterium]KAB1502795.1 NADP-dependent oxidoreductase [Corynebacterium sp. 320]KAB1550464.1 NADP-dependent oxidoreductase [Corynebacterium sp. 319]KAB1554805.1 NADP-dependent oxidoreductase [Corynebacterium sp. 321]KAB3526458.1 NADP-dependent oxidoreductase [Corynebacterium sp. 250]KAB3539777.1 NADP-dependent oxidoreductase [Corynebacterium sp. 366]